VAREANDRKLALKAFQDDHLLMLPDETACPEQIQILRRMTPEQRWQAARRLYWTMRRHKAAFMQSQNPDWPEQRIEEQVRQLFLNARA